MSNYSIALYMRLSVEDTLTDSLSIPNQRLILREKAMSLPEYENGELMEFVDNGHTGMNFERPAIQELLTLVQAGKVDCIIVKDCHTKWQAKQAFRLFGDLFPAVLTTQISQ